MLIIGFGNPGPEYNFTRHNFGFLALDFYFKTHNLEWDKNPRHKAITAKIGDNIFVKPQGFYNNSGEVVQYFTNFYKVSPSDILIVCDDFNLPFGEIRYREKGSAGGNNGLKSVIAALSTEDFPRLRLGTGNPELQKQMGDMNFVLGRFTADEKAKLPDILSDISNKIDELLA